MDFGVSREDFENLSGMIYWTTPSSELEEIQRLSYKMKKDMLNFDKAERDMVEAEIRIINKVGDIL